MKVSSSKTKDKVSRKDNKETKDTKDTKDTKESTKEDIDDTDSQKSDSGVSDAHVEELSKAVGHVNFLLGLLKKKKITLTVKVKDNEISVYRYIPARNKRLV